MNLPVTRFTAILGVTCAGTGGLRVWRMHSPRDYYKIGLRALLLHLAPLARDEIRGKDLCKMMQ